MKTKRTALIIFSLLLLALLGTAVSAWGVSSLTPASSTAIRNGQTITYTVIMTGNFTNNLTIGHVNATGYFPFHVNTTPNLTDYVFTMAVANLTGGTSPLIEGSSITLRVNASGNNNTAGAFTNNSVLDVTGLIVDITVPTASFTPAKIQVLYGEVITLDCSASSDNVDTGLTVRGHVWDPNGNEKTVQQEANTTIETVRVGGAQFDTLGINTVSCEVVDDAGNSVYATNQTVEVWNKGAKTQTVLSQPTQLSQQKRNQNFLLFGILFIVIVGSLAAYAMIKPKKRR